MQLPRDNKLFFVNNINPLWQKEQENRYAWTKAYTPDGKTFYPFYTLGTCKDYIIDAFIGYRHEFNESVLETKEAQQQNCVLLLCGTKQKQQFLHNLNTFNEFCAKQGTKLTTIIEIEVNENKYLNVYAVIGDNLWSKNAFIYSVYLTMLRILHYKSLTNDYFTQELLKTSYTELGHLKKWSSFPKYLEIILNIFKNPAQYFEDLPKKYDIRGGTENLSHSHGQYGPFNILNALHYYNTADPIYEKDRYTRLIKEGFFYQKLQNELCPIVAKPASKKRAVPTMPTTGI